MRRLLTTLSLLFLPLLAVAQEVVPPPADLDPLVLLKAFVDAIRGGQWPVVAVLVLVLLTWALRKVGIRWIPWLGTSEGGALLALLTAIATTLGAAALVPGATITWGLVGSAIAAAFAAAGGWTLARRLLRLLVPLAQKTGQDWLVALLTYLSGANVPAQVDAGAAARVVPVPAGMTPEEAARRLGAPPSVT